jgi:hypothetical protein
MLRRDILYLPSFSVESTWYGASHIVKEFHYSVDNRISILKRVTPDNPRFVACIAWKPTSETIVRYKLWEDVNEILWYPLYNGERINADFSIEIWNVKPEVATGGERTLITEEDSWILVTEEDSTEIVTEGVSSIIGSEETIEHSGTALFHLSRLILPTNNCTTPSATVTGEECTDITLDLTDFNPFIGDYYNVIGDCGETELVKGTIQETELLVLQSTDGTWHQVYFFNWAGQINVFVEQDNTDPSDTPYVVMKEIYGGLGYRVALVKIGNNHSLSIEQTDTEEVQYDVIYFLVDGLYYGGRVAKQGSDVLFVPDQTGVEL